MRRQALNTCRVFNGTHRLAPPLSRKVTVDTQVHGAQRTLSGTRWLSSETSERFSLPDELQGRVPPESVRSSGIIRAIVVL
jgi:hypothetical protein